jgi:hypothetical protein
MLLGLAQQPDLSFEQKVEAAQALYENSPEDSQEEAQATEILLTLARDRDLSSEQRLQAIKILFTAYKVNYKEQIQALDILLTILQSENAISYFANLPPNYFIDYLDIIPISQIPSLAKLIEQEIFSVTKRDDMLSSLTNMVSQFNKIAEEKNTTEADNRS